MRSIWVAPAARILHVSRILRGNGTLTHYWGLRDDGVRSQAAVSGGSRPPSRGPLARSTAVSGGRGTGAGERLATQDRSPPTPDGSLLAKARTSAGDGSQRMVPSPRAGSARRRRSA